jgi:hypothetical protein
MAPLGWLLDPPARARNRATTIATTARGGTDLFTGLDTITEGRIHVKRQPSRPAERRADVVDQIGGREIEAGVKGRDPDALAVAH